MIATGLRAGNVDYNASTVATRPFRFKMHVDLYQEH
jgi:hypothetical protein